MIFKALGDAALIVLSFLLAYYLRFKVLLFVTPASLPVIEKYFNVLLFITLIWLAIFKLTGFYDNKKFTALVDEVANIFGGVTLASLLLLGLLFLNREFWVSRLVVFNAWWIALVLFTGTRLIGFALARAMRLKGVGLRNTLIIGAGEIGQLLARKIELDPGLGYRLAGFVDDDPAKPGLNSQVKQMIGELKVEEVLIASSRLPAEKVLDIITDCERLGVEFKIVPGLLELIASRVDVDELAGVPLLTVSEIRLKGFNALLKRGVDLSASSLGLLLISPVLLAFAVLVKLTSPGPVFFTQQRVGLDGQGFPMFKFRSMAKDAEERLPELAGLSETEGHLFKIKDDPRITPLGRFMRRYSIDELPQLLNVFFGHMSLVGPRPPLPREVAKYNAWQLKRLRVRPGITGPWQVSGRSLLPFEDMVRLDIYYIENWSLWLDIKILLRTVPVVLTGRGAY